MTQMKRNRAVSMTAFTVFSMSGATEMPQDDLRLTVFMLHQGHHGDTLRTTKLYRRGTMPPPN